MRFGDAIQDGGLRLGIMQQSIEAETLPDTAKVFDAAVTAIRANEELWLEEDGERKLDIDEPSNVDAILRHTVDATADLDIDPALLEQATRLEFDGGNDIYCELLLDGLCDRLGVEHYELDTGGETDVFSVQSLAGVGALAKLASLDLDAHGYRSGGQVLTPLEGHPTLAKLALTGVESGAEVLTSLPVLAKLSGSNDLPSEVTAALTAKGIELS